MEVVHRTSAILLPFVESTREASRVASQATLVHGAPSPSPGPSDVSHAQRVAHVCKPLFPRSCRLPPLLLHLPVPLFPLCLLFLPRHFSHRQMGISGPVRSMRFPRPVPRPILSRTLPWDPVSVPVPISNELPIMPSVPISTIRPIVPRYVSLPPSPPPLFPLLLGLFLVMMPPPSLAPLVILICISILFLSITMSVSSSAFIVLCFFVVVIVSMSVRAFLVVLVRLFSFTKKC